MALKTNEYDKHLESKPVQAVTSVEKKSAGVAWAGAPSETTDVLPGLYTTNGMAVTVEGSRTINLGNYESAKIGVMITVPCSPETLNEAYDWALQWAGSRIEAEVKAAKGM